MQAASQAFYYISLPFPLILLLLFITFKLSIVNKKKFKEGLITVCIIVNCHLLFKYSLHKASDLLVLDGLFISPPQSNQLMNKIKNEYNI